MIDRQSARPNGCPDTARSSIRPATAIWALPDVMDAQAAPSHIQAGILARQTWLYLDVEDLAPGTSLPAVDANPLTVERMPGIRHDNKLRSVC